MPAKKIDHKVNHVALVVDCSGSMHRHESQVVRVVDEFVKGLQEESDRLGHETRISLYQFDHRVECLVWDMDVKRLPSMRGRYRVEGGATALIEATVTSLQDLKSEVSEKYGEHSFLQVVWTDGEENASGCSLTGRMHTSPHGGVHDRGQLTQWADRIQTAMGALPDHWTSAILVPNVLAKRTAQGYGFPAGNIAVWDADTSKGVEEAIGTVKTAATSFLRGREAGVRGTRNLFAVGQDLSLDDVKKNLVPLNPKSYKLLNVKSEAEIRPFVQNHGLPYKQGCAYYQLGPRVTVQASKEVAVLEKSTDRIFSGAAAREMLFGEAGLGGGSISVKAGVNPDLEVYVQSKSVNRKLKPQTRLLVML
ncbi:vWA domain-containing protein [Streptomyces cucumeris]|uniref:vWA domain-containing protein n=1 Tax=Streptomyces cucumeris TaxID=2962890 RepID=UPI0020C8EABB|nr:vWA domain-containing protein [Streptomyces sp. NEAU-Y11]MCP9209654.1 VWA domain-containing protein [Streptomyces sp. NEAU-Y11]